MAAESSIRTVLGERRPQDAILGEEGGETGEGELRWVIDPLDGTVNFLFGVPQFAVSVACEDSEWGIVVGVVLDPVRDECFAATCARDRRRSTITRSPAPRATTWPRRWWPTGFAYDAARAGQARRW